MSTLHLPPLTTGVVANGTLLSSTLAVKMSFHTCTLLSYLHCQLRLVSLRSRVKHNIHEKPATVSNAPRWYKTGNNNQVIIIEFPRLPFVTQFSSVNQPVTKYFK